MSHDVCEPFFFHVIWYLYVEGTLWRRVIFKSSNFICSREQINKNIEINKQSTELLLAHKAKQYGFFYMCIQCTIVHLHEYIYLFIFSPNEIDTILDFDFLNQNNSYFLHCQKVCLDSNKEKMK